MQFHKSIFNYLLTYYNDIAIDQLANNALGFDKTVLKFVVGAKKYGEKVEKHPLIYKIIFDLFFVIYPLIYIVYLFFLLFRSLVEKIRKKKCCFRASRLFLLTDTGIIRTGRRIQLYNDEDLWLLLPWTNNATISSERQISVFELVSWSALFRNFYACLVAFVVVIRRFGYKNTLYMLHAYKWFLYNDALHNIPINVELFMSNQKDRWSVLLDRLPHKSKTIVQHGTCYQKIEVNETLSPSYYYEPNDRIWILRLPYRLSTITLIYAFTEIEGRAMKNAEMKNNPLFRYIGYNLELTPIPDNRFSILIVGYYNYHHESEELILKSLQGINVDIYLKSHPLVDKKNYNSLKLKYKFSLVDDAFFPKVNLVFSYASTLALEYAALDIEVIYFNQIDFEKLLLLIENKTTALKQIKNLK